MKRFIWLVMAIGLAHVAAAQEDANDEDRGPYLGLSLGAFSYELVRADYAEGVR